MDFYFSLSLLHYDYDDAAHAMNILIADDHRFFADGLELAIGNLKGGQQHHVDLAYSAQKALAFIRAGSRYSLALVDLGMLSTGGHRLVEVFTQGEFVDHVAVVSASCALTDVQKAWQFGARGYLYKLAAWPDMQATLRALVEGRESFPNGFQASSRPAHRVGPVRLRLGKRPMQVLELVAEGKSNKQIAARLHIAEATVKFHIHNLFAVFSATNRTRCVHEAHRRGLIRPP